MWPSPETRSPTPRPRTSLPIATISPQYSWPTAIGTLIVRCAQSSQCQMCMSVPQIAVFCIRIRTSWGPIFGSGTSIIQMPGSAFALTSAFMAAPSAEYAELAPGGREGRDLALEVGVRVCRIHLRADPRLALRHDREREADDVHAELEQPVGPARREARLAEHHRDDRVLAGHQREAGGTEPGAKQAGIVPEPRAQLRRPRGAGRQPAPR